MWRKNPKKKSGETAKRLGLVGGVYLYITAVYSLLYMMSDSISRLFLIGFRDGILWFLGFWRVEARDFLTSIHYLIGLGFGIMEFVVLALSTVAYAFSSENHI